MMKNKMAVLVNEDGKLLALLGGLLLVGILLIGLIVYTSMQFIS